MRKTLIGILILTVLGGIAYYTSVERGTGTIKPDLHDFAVEDTAGITKVFLADKFGQTILLERENADEWKLNSEYKARKDLMDLLLKTIMRVEMKAPVSKQAHDNIVKLLAGKSTKVEIYKGSEKVKTYYVGDATKDNMGTYMLLEGSATPFICHIPGFTGYLTPRFLTRELEWRDTEIFDYHLAEMAEVELTFHQNPERSFKITHSEDRTVELFKTYPEVQRVESMDTVFVKRYMVGFRNIRFEGIQPYDEGRVDSIVNSPPYFTLRVRNRNGQEHTVTSYRIPADPDDVQLYEDKLEWDPDRMHAVLNGNEDEILLIQYFVFDRLTIPMEALLKQQS